MVTNFDKKKSEKTSRKIASKEILSFLEQVNNIPFGTLLRRSRRLEIQSMEAKIKFWHILHTVDVLMFSTIYADLPPVDLHWFFEISNRTEKKFQLVLKKKNQLVYTEILFQFLLKFFFSF